MALMTIHKGQLAFGDAPLLDSADFVLHEKERVCLVGRNGAGKSTLMKILAGEIQLDDGKVWQADQIKLARLEQDPPSDVIETVFEYVSNGLADVGHKLQQYQKQLDLVTHSPTTANIEALSRIQESLEISGAWLFESRIENILNALQLDGKTPVANLSGGWKRKVALARALVCDPDILLLDEPTNHLDLDTIEWLEGFLKDFRGSLVFISHDRTFIQHMATRIIDLDRGKLASYPGDYHQYLVQKEDALRVEEMQNAEFDKKLAQEEQWIRQGIKARRTRNEGRVRALKQMRRERLERRETQSKGQIQLEDVTRSGKIIFEVDDLNYQLDGVSYIDRFSSIVSRGDRIALIGPNGCGKSTLLKLLLQQLAPTSGKIKTGTQLEVAYFDQYRETLDLEQSVMDNVADGKQEVLVGGRHRHVLGYLQDFLFSPQKARTPVKALSGGEKNRLLLAKLFLKNSNLLILDEPTNDLDIETLELLEEVLANYQGSLLLVSHDRQFIDNTATSCWIFEGNGEINTYVGGYHDAQQQRSAALKIKNQTIAEQTVVVSPENNKKTERLQGNKRTRKLSYHQQKELESLPTLIEDLESKIEQVQQVINAPDFFQQDAEKTQQVLTQLAEDEKALEQAYHRWEELDNFTAENK